MIGATRLFFTLLNSTQKLHYVFHFFVLVTINTSSLSKTVSSFYPCFHFLHEINNDLRGMSTNPATWENNLYFHHKKELGRYMQ